MTITELLDAVLDRNPTTPAKAVAAAIDIDDETYQIIAAKEASAGMWRRLNRRRSQLVREVDKGEVREAAGEVRLFDPGASDVKKLIRTELIDPDTGVPVKIANLSGESGCKTLRRVAERDMTPAVTQRMAETADARIATICEERGIRPEFRPSLSLGWMGRGQNVHASRRTELRKVATTRLESMAKAAKLEINKQEVEARTAIAATALTSADARQWLDALPSADALMPPLEMIAIEEALA